MGRLNLDASVQDIVLAFSEGNPGALQVMIETLKATEQTAQAYGCLFMYDALELYGPKLYMLWNDCLGRDINMMVRLAKLWRERKISGEFIQEHVNYEGGRGKPFDAELFKEV